MRKGRISRVIALLLAMVMSLSLTAYGNTTEVKAAGNVVTFMNGSTVVGTSTVNSGSAVNYFGALENDGLLFAGWFTTNVGVINNVADALRYAYNFSSAVNSNKTLYAGWINVGTGSDSGLYLRGVNYRPVTDTYTAGIRFITKIDDSLVNSVISLNSANNGIKPTSTSQKGIGYGTVLTFADNLADGSMLVKDESATSLASQNIVVPAVNTYTYGNGYRTYTALVVNIPESYYTQHIAARPYITYADANGMVQTYYYTETSGTTHKAGGAYYISYKEAMLNALDNDAIKIQNQGGSGNENEGLTGDIPQTRPDVLPSNDRMYFLMNNDTNGAYADNEIFWCILGYNANMQLCYLDKNGNLIPATTALNTISKSDRKCADICYSLAEADHVYVPSITSGRMYISYGEQVYITINQDINGNIGYAGPDLNNTSDPNSDVYFEFAEFTITGKEYWGNTTRVDFFSFPVATRLIGEGGFCNSPGDADVYDKTVGDIGTRDEIFTAYRNEVTNEYATLVGDMRIMAPCKSTFNEGAVYGNYFDAYINEVWNKFSTQDLVFTCQAGTFRGRANGDAMVFTKDGDSGTYTVYKPTTQDVLEGKGNFNRGNSTELVIEAQMCAAFNRGIALQPENWGDNTKYYQTTPCNAYSAFFHRHSYSGLAYGFCYDDVFDNSTLLHYTNATGLIMDLRW